MQYNSLVVNKNNVNPIAMVEYVKIFQLDRK